MVKKKVLFLCTHNSCRSQMAEALLRHHFGEVYEAFSAGTEATEVNPYATKVLEELDIDTTDLRSKTTDEFLELEIFKVVTVCDNAREACPYFPGAMNYVHRSFPDPPILVEEGMEPMAAFRKARDEIDTWIISEFTP